MSAGQQAAALLGLARDTLEDARLLAERRRVNERVLTGLALRQALSAISLREGLDVSDTLGLETLLRRVPTDHPQRALVEGLRDEAARTIAAVADLVLALSMPVETPARTSARMPARAPKHADAPEPAADPGPSGPTALDASPRGNVPTDRDASATSIAFWTLIDRWRIADLDALALIGHQGGLTRKGTRPRFRLQGEEAARYAALRRLDDALATLGLPAADWLATGRQELPFGGRTPLALLAGEGIDGARKAIHFLNRQGLSAALRTRGPSLADHDRR